MQGNPVVDGLCLRKVVVGLRRAQRVIQIRVIINRGRAFDGAGDGIFAGVGGTDELQGGLIVIGDLPKTIAEMAGLATGWARY